MKKMLVILLAIMVLFGGCATKTPAAPAPATPAPATPAPATPAPATPAPNPVELTFGDWNAPTDPSVENAWTPWENFVKEKTNGEVTIKSVHGGQLGSILKVPQDLANGLYDIGIVSPVVVPDSEFYPYTITSLPYGCIDLNVNDKVLKEFYEKNSDIKGVTVIGMCVTDPYVIWSKKPIRSIDDVKGMKIRGTSQSDIALIKSWGAVPVSMVLTEQYEALQKGTLDGVLFTIPAGATYNLQEVCPYIVDMPMFVYPQVISMNNDVFNKLPAATQEQFKEVLGPKSGQLFMDSYKSSNAAARDKLSKEGKVEIITLSADKLKPFMAGASAIWDSWAADAEKKGYDGKQLIEDYKEILKANGLTPPTA